MTGRELVRSAIDHRVTARVPYFIHLCGETWEAIRDHVDAPDEGAFIDNDVAAMPPPWWTWHELAADWRGMDVPTSLPTVIGTGNYPEFADAVKRTADETGKYILLQIYGSHFEKAYFSRGIENFLADMVGAPAFARQLLSTIIDKNMVMLENVLHLPEIDGVLLGSDWGSQQDLLMSPDVWHEMIAPGEQKEYDLVHAYGKDVWIHSCGNVERIIPSLIEMGVNVLNPVQPEAMDIRKLKADYGDRLTFWGGISTQKTLPYGSAEEVRQEAREVRALMAANGGYVFAPAQSIQDDVPLDNILALLEVARESS